MPPGPGEKLPEGPRRRGAAPSLHDPAPGPGGWRRTQEVALKIDPGAKTTGLALVREDGEVLFLAEITHRGARIRKSMQQRRNCRRRRRSANLRYRKAVPEPALRTEAPALLQSRVDNVASWTERLRRRAPVPPSRARSSGSTPRRWRTRRSRARSTSRGPSPDTRSGSACSRSGDGRAPIAAPRTRRCKSTTCARRQGAAPTGSRTWPLRAGPATRPRARSPWAFLAGRPERLRRVLAQAKAPLAAAAAVNATRRVLFEALRRTGLPVTGHSGGRTKFNRTRLGIPKSHALDAACVGETDVRRAGGREP